MTPAELRAAVERVARTLGISIDDAWALTLRAWANVAARPALAWLRDAERGVGE